MKRGGNNLIIFKLFLNEIWEIQDFEILLSEQRLNNSVHHEKTKGHH